MNKKYNNILIIALLICFSMSLLLSSQMVFAERENIVRMTGDSTPTLDPGAHTGNTSSIAYCNIYDTLVFPASDGEVKPDLAESWESNEDGTEYVFTLKKGVQFHDGSELTASDVVFTMTRMQTMGEGFAYMYEGIVKDTVADDDYTVRFILERPYAPFVKTLCRLYILNEDLVMEHLEDGAFGDMGDYGRAWLLQNDAGSGPYTTIELVQNDHFLCEKFEDWHMSWDGRENAPLQFEIIYGTEPATVRTMMSTQQLEVSDQWQSPESLQALKNLDGVDLASYSTRLMQNIIFNCSLAPTDDINIRKALCHCVDYDSLIEVCYPGSKQPAGPVSFYTDGHVDCTQYEYNLEKAKEYISASQYADSIGDYELTFLVNSDNAVLSKVALQLQAAAKSVGINIKVEKATWNMFQEQVSRAETTPNISCCNSGPSFNEAGATLESQYHSKTAGSYENCSWCGSDELDEKINEVMSIQDNEERYEKYAEMQNFITDDICPIAWLADLTERVAYQEAYITFPAAEASKNGEITAYLMGYPFFMPDFVIDTSK